MRITVLYSLVLVVASLAYSDAAAPQLLKSQSLIPFPRVGRSRADFLQSMASINNEGGGGGSSLINTKPNMAAIWGAYQRQRDGNGQPIKDNTKKVIRWNVKNNVDLREFKRHLIPFPRVGKRQSLIPFPRVGRSQLHFYPLDEDEGVVLSAEDSLTPIYPIGEIVPATSGVAAVNNGIRRGVLDDRTFYIPQMRWTTSSNSQESEESN